MACNKHKETCIKKIARIANDNAIIFVMNLQKSLEDVF
jgi:hypothetical protein